MTNGRFHLLYIAIIGFLAYQYRMQTEVLENTTQSVEQLDGFLKKDNQAVAKSVISISIEIEKQVYAYRNPTNETFRQKADNTVSVINNIYQWLENQKQEIIKASGGFDKNDTTLLANPLSTNVFPNQKLQELQDSLKHFESVLMDISNTIQLKGLQEQYLVPKLLNNAAYWQKLKSETAASLVAHLSGIQSQIQLDEMTFLNYVLNQVSGGVVFEHDYHIAIAPLQVALIEGDTFKTDVYLAAYSSNPGANVKFIINNKEVAITDGIAHFETKETTVGKKTLKAEASIRNPYTGQIVSRYGSFEYEVLPKCSRDCK